MKKIIPRKNPVGRPPRSPLPIQEDAAAQTAPASPERLSRTQEARAAEPVHEPYADIWEPSGLLNTDNMPPRAGYVQRWVRTHVHGLDDPSNVMRKFNERWRPRLADSVPAGAYVPTIDFRGSSVIGVQGCILMERRIEDHEAHRRHHRELIDAQIRAQRESLFKVHNPNDTGFGAPSLSVQSRVERGRALVMDD